MATKPVIPLLCILPLTWLIVCLPHLPLIPNTNFPLQASHALETLKAPEIWFLLSYALMGISCLSKMLV